ncbi:uncharacterized protein ASPGLDRAFT_40343 [Aspergillus glaucus CBS 516.65]|uniref:Uncharacterized protein n=1 Tax=Aspergillus glaucus CBS 516.65 TaxID=1160497 RepID=A0A1L9V4T2_ASPGL|nr:hypothetical protein ASPGLDRAFT_40343 [Aspergillus glaucus CBS 516.65]OJJ78953.1 hypothetical protein ASPGLDRAFT_40343 [Aspergillus glaucus CBS 516.65]
MARVSDHALSYYSPSHPSLLVDASGMHVDEDGFLQSRQRAGGPYLCSLPANRELLEVGFIYKHTPENVTNVREKTAQILASAEINYTEIAITGRRSQVDSESSPVLTVLIVTKGGSQREKWRDVTKQVTHAISGDLHDDFSVELIDEILHQQFNTSPVLKTDSIYSVRDKVCGSILEELNLPDPRCVGCYRYGPSIRREENPPIIIVGIRDKTTRSFHDDNKKVQGILECFGVTDTSVLFRKESS